MSVPVTEACNDLSTNIDVATPEEIVSILHKCDAEIFNGWKEYEGIYHPSILDTIQKISLIASSVIKDPNSGLIVLSGCGTSGRIGFMIARSFNAKLEDQGKEPCFRYLIAGGDKALFTSQEAPEDDPLCGIQMLKEVSRDKRRVLFLGITCGLSAPYVAGQLDYCIENPDVYTPVLIGFNPTNQARSNRIEKWTKTFQDVVRALEDAECSGKAFILNPVVGPEPITGSSRMKSGSATKLLLETIFVGAYTSSQNECSSPPVVWNCKSHLDIYKSLHIKLSRNSCSSNMAKLIQIAGNSLQNGCSIYYIGMDSLGIVGLIDASECPPTYSATLDDVRGFLNNGYDTFRNVEGDISSLGKHFKISLEDLERDIIPHLRKDDLVIVLSADGDLDSTLINKCSSCHTALITFTKTESLTLNQFEVIIYEDLLSGSTKDDVNCSVTQEFASFYCEMFTKWVCNAVTTGAHIIKGKVFQNIMIDLKVSNTKLYYRSVGIIQKFSNISIEEAEIFLQRSIYYNDDLTSTQRNATVAEHIDVANNLTKVVPRALLAAILKSPIAEAETRLEKEPVIRAVISQTLLTMK